MVVRSLIFLYLIISLISKWVYPEHDSLRLYGLMNLSKDIGEIPDLLSKIRRHTSLALSRSTSAFSKDALSFSDRFVFCLPLSTLF